MEGIRIAAFTATGAKLAERLCAFFPGSTAYLPQAYRRPGQQLLELPIRDWAKEYFASSEALIFIGAAGIAVRACGSLASSKASDPAVLCLDEKGQFVIPLLSGHIGGANKLAREIAAAIGAVPVITTATDVQGIFSPDGWAAEHGCSVPKPEQVRKVSAALLAGETIGLYSDFPIDGNLPDGVENRSGFRCGIVLSLQEKPLFEQFLWLTPRCLQIGVGCRKGTDPEVFAQSIEDVLEMHNLPIEAVAAVGTISLKAEEPAVEMFCKAHRLPLRVYTSEELQAVEGSEAESEFVRSITGVGNVCERAALAAGGILLVEKTVRCGVTVAVAQQDWRARFCIS